MRQPVPSAGAGRACHGGVAGPAGKHQILVLSGRRVRMIHACTHDPNAFMQYQDP